MTSATDELRRLLDERGVEWTSGCTEVSRNEYTHFCPDAGMSVGVWESGDGNLGIDAHTDYRFTPEQAIAATLGGGMLTADDVRDLIERHSDAAGGNGRDFHNGAYVAIADELNATLGSCNCSDNCTNSERTGTCHDSNKRFNAWQCSECGATLLLMFDDYGEPTYSVDGVADMPKYCPNCGKVVVE